MWSRCLLCVLLLIPGTLASQGRVHRFVGDDPNAPIGRSFELLTDPQGSLTWGQVRNSTDLIPSDMPVPNLGITDHVHWLRMRIENATASNSLVLFLNNPEVDELEIRCYVAGREVIIARTGLGMDPGREVKQEAEPIFHLPIPSGVAGEVLIRTRSGKQLLLPFLLNTPEQARRVRAARNMAVGFYVGIMLVLALYNLFVFLSIRDRSYLLYVVYILLVCLTQLTLFGIGPAHLWPGMPWLRLNASLILTLSTATVASEFTRSLLNTRSYTPVMDRGIKWFYGSFVIGAGLYLLGPVLLGYKISQAVSGLFAFYIFAMILVAWRRGNRQAGMFLLAWSLFLMGTLVFVLKDMGVLPYGPVTMYTMPVGSAIEGILLSFILADRINILRREKERSQAEALRVSQENERIIREQNQLLEQKVDERTQALQASNEHLKRTQSQLVNAEKMASLGQLTAGIAHEINNPVNFITSNIPPLRRDLEELLDVLDTYREGAVTGSGIQGRADRLDPAGIDATIEEVKEILSSIEEGAERTAEIVRGLRNFSRLDEADLKLADINECVQSTLTVLAPHIKGTARIDLDLAPLPQVECYPGKLNQVIMNVLNNAVQAITEQGAAFEGVIRLATHLDGDQVVLSITDNGPGMADAVRERIFEPFFTTKEVGKGTGLGLSIAYSIIEKHHGSIVVESAVGMGTTFRIELPIRQPQEHRQRA